MRQWQGVNQSKQSDGRRAWAAEEALAEIYKKSIRGQGTSKCKRPEAGKSLAWKREVRPECRDGVSGEWWTGRSKGREEGSRSGVWMVPDLPGSKMGRQGGLQLPLVLRE